MASSADTYATRASTVAVALHRLVNLRAKGHSRLVPGPSLYHGTQPPRADIALSRTSPQTMARVAAVLVLICRASLEGSESTLFKNCAPCP